MKNTLTTISDEHKALVASLVEELQEKEMNTLLDYYDAVREAAWTLRDAMEDQYHIDALIDVADAFDELFHAIGGTCGRVGAGFFREVLDEDGDVDENEEVDSWEDATYAQIRTSGVNYSPSFRATWTETFASDIAYYIEQCIHGWEYSEEDESHDADYQDFEYRK